MPTMMLSRYNMNDAGHPLSNGVSTNLTVQPFNVADPDLWFLPSICFFNLCTSFTNPANFTWPSP
ncbi:hypothetical protein T11_13548 [Trichinella zimbabwensis]|uniref:Uncharacterized protein n=1 Tax=Trichinella zimbabwensis TaxID=268475 RepID=A0A0V1GUI1_9BILA|nr:hypothetical protein T11_13548 [Trichinella zimbabwensis]